ncbi:MAG: OmpH family outer membrane protein [Bacteroidales bacterium]|nr:OmpH family outer membrane protein [Bacteroidales bacterium]MDD4655899.1 OmpH family outer membrane protein [Bacteroidales bacterium]
MRKIVIFTVLMLSMSIAAVGQTVGFVNTETILAEVPEYVQAQQQLERLKQQYEIQLQNEVKIIENLFSRYQSQKSALGEMERQARENEIITKERAVKEKQQEIFGQEGVMAAKSKELMDPIMDVVQKAVDKVAQENGYLLILDLASLQGVIYKDAKVDLTPLVLKKLGL